MSGSDAQNGSGQPRVDHFFDSAAGYWSDVYGRTGLQGQIYRERMYTALRWIDDLELPRGARVLELGCGAGLLSAELARRGYRVTAADSSPEMVRLASERARALPKDTAMTVIRADVHALPFGSGEFELVVALGLLPWLDDPARAVAEIERVLAAGGSAVLTADNRARLNFLVDPRENPVLLPLKLPFGIVKRAIGRTGQGAPSYLHLPGEISGLLTSAGLRTVRRATIGYGPLTVMGRPVLSESAGLRLHAVLVALSRDRAPSLRRHGWHYVVAARKPRD